MPLEPLFRLGTTSYILPDDLLPNVRYLAGKVQDVELVLFEVDGGPTNLPAPDTIAGLRALALEHNLTYTVHLPLDLRLIDSSGMPHSSLFKARKVIEITRALDPWAYVLHLDGHEFVAGPTAPGLTEWQAQAVQALKLAAEWSGGPQHLAVENLDGYPPEFCTPILALFPASRTIDIGHLWKDGVDPLPYLERHLSRARVLHIHGVGTHDHQSLAHVSPAELDAVLSLLIRRAYRGILTLEIFGEDDFHTSLAALHQSLQRLG